MKKNDELILLNRDIIFKAKVLEIYTTTRGEQVSLLMEVLHGEVSNYKKGTTEVIVAPIKTVEESRISNNFIDELKELAELIKQVNKLKIKTGFKKLITSRVFREIEEAIGEKIEIEYDVE